MPAHFLDAIRRSFASHAGRAALEAAATLGDHAGPAMAYAGYTRGDGSVPNEIGDTPAARVMPVIRWIIRHKS
jgi:hypothetical protein